LAVIPPNSSLQEGQMTKIEVRSPYEQHPQREAMKGRDLLFAEIGTSVLKSVTDESLRVVPLAGCDAAWFNCGSA